MFRNTLIPLVVLCLLSGGCGDRESAGKDISERPVNIVATTGMVADLAGNIGGSRVNVTGLMGAGVDPHLYKASERDVSRMSGADIIFFNGLHLEGAMSEVLERMKGRRRTVAVAGGIEPGFLISPEGYKGTQDPHIWFDVSLWMKAGVVVRDALILLDSTHADVYRANAESYLAELQDLHDYVIEQASRIPKDRRVLITAHDAFGYFGRAYDFEVRGLQGISTASEAGTADVQKLASLIAERKIPAVFVESSVPQRSIEAVQAAVKARGFEVRIGGQLFSDAMGNRGTPEGTYRGMVKHNIDTIVKALLEG